MNFLRTNTTDWAAALFLILCPAANGQATPSVCGGTPIHLDGSTPGVVFGNTRMRIQGGQLSGDGLNLFHNFSCFNIPANTSAVFRNSAPGIKNIIARVTGSESSIIGGDLSTQLGPDSMGRARVFLLNPNGVLFNGNSSIDLNGLAVSTAHSLGFDGGATVTLDSTADDLENATGSPVFFGNLSDTGTVQFDDARILMTGGGDILIIAKDVDLRNDSRITTQGAQVMIAGAGTGNSVAFDVSDRTQLPMLDHPATGQVNMEGFSGISTSDESGGRIVIRGGRLTLTNSNPLNAALDVAGAGNDSGIGIDVEATQSLTLTRSQISTGSRTDGTASDIQVRAPLILMNNEVSGQNDSAIRTEGRGGDITIDANLLSIHDGGIVTHVEGGGIGGTISIDADQLTITDRSSIRSLAAGSSSGGDIRTTIAGDLTIDGNGATRLGPDGVRIPETVGIVANTFGTGPGGEVTVDVGGDLTLRNGGIIDSTSISNGASGRIRVSASNLVIDGENFEFATGITAFTTNQTSLTAGRGGDIEVDVPGDIRILNGGGIDTSSFGAGDAGLVQVGLSKAPRSIVIDKGTATRFTGIGSDASGSGDAGEVTVKTASLTIENGGLISTAVFYRPIVDDEGNLTPADPGSGRGGDVNVFANTLRLSGSSLGGDDGTSVVANSAIYAGTQTGSSGAGGNVVIKPLKMASEGLRPSVQLSDGAEIGARAEGTGDGGSVDVRYPEGQIELDSGSSISARSGEMGGSAGSVSVEGKRITLRNNSSISSTNEANSSIPGKADDEKLAGSVTLIPGDLKVDDSSIEVSSRGGDAGELRIEGGALLDFLYSEVVAEAFGDGGDVTIVDAQALLLDHCRVSANANEDGDGGNIQLEAIVILSNESSVTASSERGVDGIVRIDSQAVLNGTEDDLDASPLDDSDQLQPECTKRLTTKSGSFIRSGRGGLARLPGGYLPSVRLHRSQ